MKASFSFLKTGAMMQAETDRIDISCDGIGGTLVAAPSGRGPLLACIHGGGCGGRYFEVARVSTLDLAVEQGWNVLLVNRPGYGGTPPLSGQTPIADSIAPIRRLIGNAIDRLDGCREVALVGHSIGGAIALMLAAHPDGLPLRGLAVSGIGDEPPSRTRAWAASADPAHETPDVAADMFFGPAGSYDWRGPAALRRAAEPWHMHEVVEVVTDWPRQWPGVAAAIRLPVHLRLAAQDTIWESGKRVVDRMVAALTGAPVVDAALMPGGHAAEMHLHGPEMVRGQLAFLRA